MNCQFPFLSVISVLLVSSLALVAGVRIASAPVGEVLSKDYKVQIDGRDVPVYQVKVASADRALRFKAMDDKANSADYFGKASFAYFDMDSPVSVRVICPNPIQSAKILPSSYQITPNIDGNSLVFTLPGPKPVTIEIDGTWVGALHLFANPIETGAPASGDPNVIYYGPGIHYVTCVVVTNNQTVYVAPGAIVRGITGQNEPHHISSYSHLPDYAPAFELRGDHIRFCGRGVIDFSEIPKATRQAILVRGNDITIEGVIVRDSSTWTLPIRQSDHVTIRNVKLLGRRANSDGIDICNSDHVTVEDCFIRTLDDLIVVKTFQGETHHVVVRHCVLWNEVAHALSIGAELRRNVDDILFTDCDVIHDFGREWTLRIFQCDSSLISNVRFENLRVEQSPRLISLWINKAVYSAGPERGHIDHVVFKNIQATANPLHIDLNGYDATHLVNNVEFENVFVNGRSLLRQDIKTNAFVRNVTVSP